MTELMEPESEEQSTGRLHRSKADRVLSGVCGGIAETYGWDPGLVRLAYAALTVMLAFVPGIVLYIIAVITLPEE